MGFLKIDPNVINGHISNDEEFETEKEKFKIKKELEESITPRTTRSVITSTPAKVQITPKNNSRKIKNRSQSTSKTPNKTSKTTILKKRLANFTNKSTENKKRKIEDDLERQLKHLKTVNHETLSVFMNLSFNVVVDKKMMFDIPYVDLGPANNINLIDSDSEVEVVLPSTSKAPTRPPFKISKSKIFETRTTRHMKRVRKTFNSRCSDTSEDYRENESESVNNKQYFKNIEKETNLNITEINKTKPFEEDEVKNNSETSDIIEECEKSSKEKIETKPHKLVIRMQKNITSGRITRISYSLNQKTDDEKKTVKEKVILLNSDDESSRDDKKKINSLKNSDVESLKNDNTDEDSNNIYTCTICKQEFTSNCQCKLHELQHNNDFTPVVLVGTRKSIESIEENTNNDTKKRNKNISSTQVDLKYDMTSNIVNNGHGDNISDNSKIKDLNESSNHSSTIQSDSASEVEQNLEKSDSNNEENINSNKDGENESQENQNKENGKLETEENKNVSDAESDVVDRKASEEQRIVDFDADDEDSNKEISDKVNVLLDSEIFSEKNSSKINGKISPSDKKKAKNKKAECNSEKCKIIENLLQGLEL